MSMKPLRLSSKNLFICADLHYGHDNKIIWGQRGCGNIQAHDRMIEEELDKLPRKARIIQLGDIAVCKLRKLEAFFNRRPDLTWYHIFGNHDEALEALAKKWARNSHAPANHIPLGDSALVAIRSASLDHPGYRTVWLSHYPCALWPSEAEWHACGHAHARLKEYNPGRAVKPMLDLGVENALGEGGGGVFLSWPQVDELFRSAVIPQFSASVKYNSGDKVMIGGCVATIISP
jgi:calcineurin-like phosphoesterase family protein